MKTLDDADEEDVVAMTEDPTIGMKKPHRTLFMKAWKARIEAEVPRAKAAAARREEEEKGGGGGGGGGRRRAEGGGGPRETRDT
jgi:uncharacterized membrane protein